jgi:ABC-type multidrug transport system ATPase subunit
VRITITGRSLDQEPIDTQLLSLSTLLRSGWRVDLNANVAITAGGYHISVECRDGMWLLPLPARSASALDKQHVLLNDKEAVRKVLGYLPQEIVVYPRVSAYEMLDHIALLKGVVDKGPRKELVEALLQRVNLWEHRKRRISGFSGGMKQRFGIAQSLIGDPKLIIVDEPTAGLDPGERNRFYNLLTEIGENVVVILSTHIVQDVQELCNNMAIINKGQLLYAGAPNDALKAMKGKVWEKAIGKQELKRLGWEER